MSSRADALTARIAAAKRRLLAGGALREVEWGVPAKRPPADVRGRQMTPIDPPDARGRRTFTFSTIDAFIEQRPALDRSALTTERADNTVLTILEPVAIKDDHLFRWGDPPQTYRVKSVDGLLQDEETGTRFSSVVTVIR